MPYVLHYSGMLYSESAMLLKYGQFYSYYLLFEHDYTQELLSLATVLSYVYGEGLKTNDSFISAGYHPALVGFCGTVLSFCTLYGAFYWIHLWCTIVWGGGSLIVSWLVRNVIVACLTCSRYRRGSCRVERIIVDLSAEELAAAAAAAAAADPVMYAQQHRKGTPGGLGLALTPVGRHVAQFAGSPPFTLAVKIGAIRGAGEGTATTRAKARLRINDVIIGINGSALLPKKGLPLGSFDALQLVRQAVFQAEEEAEEDSKPQEYEEEQEEEPELEVEVRPLVLPTVSSEALYEFYEEHDSNKSLEECRSLCIKYSQADLQQALRNKYGKLPRLVEGAASQESSSGRKVPVGVMLPVREGNSGGASSEKGFLLTAEALLRFYLVTDPTRAAIAKNVITEYANKGVELRARLLHKYGAEKLLKGLLPPASRCNRASRILRKVFVSPGEQGLLIECRV
jgi:hypothetical protein